jgi:tight adherence protein C
MLADLLATFPWFMAASSLVLLAYLLVASRKDPVGERLGEVGGSGRAASAKFVEDKSSEWMNRRVRREETKRSLKERLKQAGLYRPRALPVFVASRVLLALAPAAIGYLASRAGHLSMPMGLAIGGAAGLFGTLAPSFWLDHVKRARQTKIRRALPDAMDVMAVCLEGGLSLSGSLARVSRELATAHPMLAVEFQIVERQTQMGRTTGEAVREMANRFDLEELRSMASVIVQAERIGSSVSEALEVFADTLRQRRHQRAEEMAQKASIKLLFPTLLFIFPGIFIVILGPAAIQIYQVLLQGVMRNI